MIEVRQTSAFKAWLQDLRDGYRVYFVRRGDTVVILLCGGDKGSQDRDISRAKRMADEV